MRSTLWVMSAVISSSFVVGCSAEVAPTNESSAVAKEALGSFSQSVDLADQTLSFSGPAGTTGVHAHLTINGARATNGPMFTSGGSFQFGPLAILPGDQLAYSFTYVVNGVSTTTQTFNFTVPLTFQPLALNPRVDRSSDFVISLASKTPISWADVHYTINGGTTQNVRIPAGGLHVMLNSGDDLHYTMTYNPGNDLVFDTGAYDYFPADASIAYMWVDETSSKIVCQSTGTCTPWPFSAVYTDGGYHSSAPNALVPQKRVLVNNGFTHIDIPMMNLAFTYTGGTPRVGTGLALIGAASDGSGSPPSSSADTLRGKNLAETPGIASNYVFPGGGLAIALVDVNSIWSNQVDVPSHAVMCDSTKQCLFKVDMSEFSTGSAVDLTEIRYVAFITEANATGSPNVLVGGMTFDMLF
jgi:hypothetical protein